jgi:hypothetical protein
VKLIIVLVFDLIVDDTMNHLFLFFSHREILNIDTDKNLLALAFFIALYFLYRHVESSGLAWIETLLNLILMKF